MSELVDKYDRKSFTAKEKKYIISIIKIVVGALFIPSGQIVIEKRIEDLT